MFEQALTQAIEQFRQIEQDAQLVALLRSGKITGITAEHPGFRVSTEHTFAVGSTIEDALSQVLEKA